MQFVSTSFRHAGVILNEPDFVEQFSEVIDVIQGITEQDIINKHTSYGAKDEERVPKSLSVAINELFKERFVELNWIPESEIFQDSNYQGDTWRLDFAKKDISIEVAFNQLTVITWSLINQASLQKI
jgi:hypothetical protein